MAAIVWVPRWLLLDGMTALRTDDAPLPRLGDSVIGPGGERMTVTRIDRHPFGDEPMHVATLRAGGQIG